MAHMVDAIARSYQYAVFLAHHRFDVSRKRLETITYDDCEAIASAIVRHWCTNDGAVGIDSLELDRRVRTQGASHTDTQTHTHTHICIPSFLLCGSRVVS